MRRVLLAAVTAMIVTAWPAQAQLFPTAPGAEPKPGSASSAVDTSAFAGRWIVRTGGLRITRDGHGIAEWKLNRWCTESAPPCDDSNQDLGGVAALTFTEVKENVVIGQVDWSTYEGMFRAGPVSLTFLSDGSVEVSSNDGRRPAKLCGPKMKSEDRIFWGC